MTKLLKWLGRGVIAMLVVASVTGCEEIKEAMREDFNADDPTSEDYNTRFVVGIFSIVDYPRSSNLEKTLESNDGRTVVINTNQFFSSKNLREARVIARPGNPDVCDLQFRLDRRGRALWRMLAGRFHDEDMVLAVDGVFAAKFVPELVEDDSTEWVTLRVGIDHYTARGIAKYAKKNYTHYNPKTEDWFSSL